MTSYSETSGLKMRTGDPVAVRNLPPWCSEPRRTAPGCCCSHVPALLGI